jgi:predicted aldo/keto reductase-like oxidoreductase
MIGKRRLGRTGVDVALLGFGGIPIMRLTPEDAVAVTRHALEQGIELFDTARGYGDSEAKMGRALEPSRSRVFLASKSPKRSAAGLLEDFEQSADNLRVETIDLYQMHCVNTDKDYDTVMTSDGAYHALRVLKSSGRIRFLGITSHSLAILKRAILSGRFDTIQVLFSFVEDEAAREVIPMALSRNVGVIGMKPLGGGVISRYDLALRHVLSTDGVIAIPGMATCNEVDLNVEVAADLRPLGPGEIEEISSIREEIGRVFCRRCDYCQPCPNDVPVSLLLHVESIRRRIGDRMMRSDAWKETLRRASACDECGQCEERCPFALPVRDLLRESRRILAEVLD